MAPIVHATADTTPAGTGTTLELSLITVSIALTVLVQILQKLPGRALANSRLLNRTSVAFTLYSLTVSIFLSSLVLGWQRRITLEALVAIIFALAPTLATVSSIIVFTRRFLLLLWNAYRNGFSINALIDDDQLCHLRIETPCRSTAIIGDAHPVAACLGDDCNAQIYCVRHGDGEISPSPLSVITKAVYKKLLRIRAPQTASICIPLSLHTRRAGSYFRSRSSLKADIVHHGKHTIDVRPTAEQPRPWSFDYSPNISFALSLIDEPHKSFLETRRQAYAVLNLIMEILMIGELVYFVRGEYLDGELQKLVDQQMTDSWTSLKGRSMLVHNRVIERLQISDWMLDNIEHFTADGAPNRENQSRLFYLLLEKSELLYEHPVRSKGNRAICVVRRIQACNLDAKEFEDFLYNEVDQWLVSWGCDLMELCDTVPPALVWPFLPSTIDDAQSV